MSVENEVVELVEDGRLVGFYFPPTEEEKRMHQAWLVTNMKPNPAMDSVGINLPGHSPWGWGKW